MDIIFLGTGAGMPAKERNVSSIALNLAAERGTTWLFDCGEATQHQILQTTIRPRKLEKIFITHLHGDHIFGLPGLLGSRSFQDGDTLLTVYGPKGIRDFIDVALMVSQTHLKYDLDIIEISEGIIFEDDQFTVEAKRLEHGVESFGYRIVERETIGALDVEKLQQLGIKPGPIYQRIKAGERIVLDNGEVIYGHDFLGQAKPGRKLAILGDTRFTDHAIKLAKDVDVLVHEATFSRGESRLAHDYFHSTTEQAAIVAQTAGAKHLILTHISSRYQSGEQSRILEKEAKEIFANTWLAKDFWTFHIPKKEKDDVSE